MAIDVPPLPVELTDQIIARVVDQRALLNCCLVCSRWLPASRHHLFRIVQITDRVQYELLVSSILHSDRLRPYLSSVVEVFLNDYRLRSQWEHGRPVYLSSWIFLFTQEFAGHMPNLTVLALHNFKDHCWPGRPSALLALSQLPSLRELRLVVCTLPSSHALRRILSALPSLTTLQMSGVSWAQPSIHADGRKALPTSLTSLRLLCNSTLQDHQCAQQLLTWLCATPTPSSLRTLSLDIVSDPVQQDYSRVFGLVLQQFVRLVTTLHISVFDTVENDQSLLSQFSNLTRIVMGLSNPKPDAWIRFSHILRYLPEPAKLTTITIGVFGPFRERRTSEGIGALDSLLEGDRCKGLKEVKVRLHQQWSADSNQPQDMWNSREDALEAISSELPELLSRPFVHLYLPWYDSP